MALLTTKLHIPAPRPGAVPRPQLLARLDEGLRRGRRLTLVCAPVGYGKTTVAAEWVRILADAGRSAMRYSTAWLSLDDNDNDPVRFLTYLAAALRAVGIPVEEPAPPTLQASPVVPIESGVTVLLNALDAYAAPVLLVLDDYHVIRTPAIHEAVELFLDRLPPPAHLVLLSRIDPPLPIARWRARGQLTELRAADLRLDIEETAAFLQQTAGLDLPRAAIEALAFRMEGWAAGVQLAAVSLQGQEPAQIPEFIEELTGSHRYIMDYLVEEVLERQPPAIQAFLLQSSVLERLCGSLCDAVVQPGRDPDFSGTGLAAIQGSASQAILEYLERANLFLIPLDRERRWYRYHHLFADLLRRRLNVVAEPDWPPVEELHARAVDWLAHHGLIPEAIEHALAAGDFADAAGLIQSVAGELLERSEIATLMDWLAALPVEQIRAHPLLGVAYAWGLLLSGHPLREVEAVLPAEPEEDSPVFALVAPLRAFQAFFRGQIEPAATLARQALDRLPPELGFFRALAAWILGFTAFAHDRAAGLQIIETIARNERQGIGTILSIHHLADLQIWQGNLHSAQALYERALALVQDAQGRRLPIAGLPLIGLGEIYREWNELETAARYLNEGIRLLQRWAEILAMDGYLSLALLHQARGEPEAARNTLGATLQLARRFEMIDYDDALVEIHIAWLAVLQGDLPAAQRWAEAWGLGDDYRAEDLSEEGDPMAMRQRRREILVLARLRLAQGRPAEAQILMERMLALLETLGMRRQGLEARLLLALALQAQGKTGLALENLVQVLARAEPEGFIRLFVDEGLPMADLLALFRQRQAQGRMAAPVSPNYVSRLLEVFAAGSAPAAGPASLLEGLPEPLNEREREILALIAVGCSNQEIAAQLYLALPTVKWHVGHLYGKLGVKTRVQAVARARELGLL